MAHGNTVVYRDGMPLNPKAAVGINGFFDHLANLVQVYGTHWVNELAMAPIGF